MINIVERTKTIIHRDRLDDIRTTADEKNIFCFFASLYEIASLAKGTQLMPPRIENVWVEHVQRFPEFDQGTVPISLVLDVMSKYCLEIGLNIKRVLVNPSLLDKVIVPFSLKEKIITVTGTQQISALHVRIMAQQDNMGTWHTHAETDAGDEKSKARFETLNKIGWKITGMIIEFEKINE